MLTGPTPENPIHEEVRAVMAPGPLQSKRGSTFQPTRQDDARLVAAARRVLVPTIVKLYGRRFIRENPPSFLRVAQALDLDGNGRKDLVGLYIFNNAVVVPDPQGDVTSGGADSILFALRDTDTVEEIAIAGVGDKTISFHFGVGPVDIDQDGHQELIIQVGITAETHHDIGTQVRVMRREGSR